MHYMSWADLVKENPTVTQWNFTNSNLVLQPKLEMLDDPDGAPFYVAHSFQERGAKIQRFFINTVAHGWVAIPRSAWIVLREAIIDLGDDPDYKLMANSEFIIRRSGAGIQSQYRCTRLTKENPMPPVYLIIAYMPEGTTIDGSSSFTKEFFEKDRPGPDWKPPGLFSIPRQTIQLASMVVRIEVATGKSEVLKNRWGPLPAARSYSQSWEKADGVKDLPPTMKWNPEELSKILKEVEDDLSKAFETTGMKKSHTWITVDSLPPGEFKISREDGLYHHKSEFATPVSVKEICKCSMADLLSTGHNDGCPEKKR